MAVKIVTDSTSDLPPELAAELGVTVVPLTVFFGEQAFKDGVDIGHDEFFERLTTGGVLPSTTQPSVGEFTAAYEPLVREGHDIVSIHISDKLSGTLNSARNARQEFPDAKIELVDTRGASIAIALAVKAAAEAANAGADADAVAEIARAAAENTAHYFVLDTLEYLQKGGRIGKAQAWFGSLLSIKPVLTLRDGEIHPLEKVRTRVKAVQRMKELAAEGAPYEEIALTCETTEAEAAELSEHLAAFTDRPILRGRLGAVIGTYAGPGVIGFALRKR